MTAREMSTWHLRECAANLRVAKIWSRWAQTGHSVMHAEMAALQLGGAEGSSGPGPLMTTWFTSDQHFGHKNIIAYSKRPFASVEEMGEEIIRRHNSIVKTSDTVIHLGDFALDERLVEPTLKRLNGRHHLIAGNHDKCHACHRQHLKMSKKYVEWGFAYVRQHGMETLRLPTNAGESWCVDVFLSHLPYRGDTITEKRPKGEERYPEFRLTDGGRWLLHGHVHEHWRIRDRMINVGVDQWDFTPVDERTLVAIIWNSEFGCGLEEEP